ncbi:MAG TPA: class I SAM-dependent methyltransferase [bacterium]
MKKSNKRADRWFKKWAVEYDNTLGKIKRHHRLLDLVVQMSGVRKNDRVLDLGCGTGLLSLKFVKKAKCTVQGMDRSPEMLQLFERKIKKLRLSDQITCKLADAERLSLKNDSFDIIASTVTLHHVRNKVRVLKKIHAILKPGGRFILGDIDMDTTGKLTDPRRLKRILDYLNDELVLALQEGGIRTFSRMYDNGKKHILNDGEYCIGFVQWKRLCQQAEFKNIRIVPLPSFKRFKVLVGVK